MIEVLIATGLVTSVAMAFASFVNQQSRSVAAMSAKQSALGLQSYLTQTLKSSDVCGRMARNKEFDTSKNPSPTSLSFGRIYSGKTGTATLIQTTTDDGKPQPLSDSDSQYTIRSIRLENIFKLDDSETKYHGEYKVRFQSPPGFAELMPITVPVVLNVESAGGGNKRITECGQTSSEGDVGSFCGLGEYSCVSGVGGNCGSSLIHTIATCQGEFPKRVGDKCPLGYISQKVDTYESYGTRYGEYDQTFRETTIHSKITCVKAKE